MTVRPPATNIEGIIKLLKIKIFVFEFQGESRSKTGARTTDFFVRHTEDAEHCRTVNQTIDYVIKTLKLLDNIKFCLLSQQSFAHCTYSGNINSLFGASKKK